MYVQNADVLGFSQKPKGKLDDGIAIATPLCDTTTAVLTRQMKALGNRNLVGHYKLSQAAQYVVGLRCLLVLNSMTAFLEQNKVSTRFARVAKEANLHFCFAVDGTSHSDSVQVEDQSMCGVVPSGYLILDLVSLF